MRCLASWSQKGNSALTQYKGIVLMDQQNLASGFIHSASAAAAAPAMVYAPERTVKAVPMDKLTPRRQFKLAITRLAVILATVFTGRYFYWRLLHTINPAAKVFFYAFLVVELLSFIESAFFYFVTWNPTHYARPDPLPGRTVDVFIPTYNEPVELLRETVLCAVNMRYPHKTYVLDDGRRSEVRELAQEFGCGYITRDDRTNAKAGNLNNALLQTDGEFIVTLDADHVASPELIEEMIGFFGDSSVGVVQGTQDFYNLDSFQHQVNWSTRAGWQQQELFFSVIQPGKDRYNAAFYCGSPGILRRSSLDDVGGFATDSITEDMHTSLRLQKKGWRVVYHNRTVARGLAPQTFSSFATQWQRWGHGAMQVLRAEKPFFTKGLSFTQKLAYFSSFYFYWMSYQKLAFVLTPIITLFFGIFPLVTNPTSYASYFLPYFCLNIACSVLLQGGWQNFMMSERFNLLKMHVLMKTLTGLFHRDSPFTVTRKSRASAPRASEVLLPFLLLLGLALALAAGIVRIQMVRTWGFVFWALAVNIFWGIVFLFMMGGMVKRSQNRLEHRKSYRFPSHLELRMSVSYKEAGGEVKRDGFARNLNRSGVSVTFEREIPQGTKVQVELRLPEHTIQAAGKVVRNQSYGKNGHSRISSGIRFDKIAPADQDEISKYLFFEIAPQHGRVLNLTHTSQTEAHHS
jgi:cellulose synthase (UDP-forming)